MVDGIVVGLDPLGAVHGPRPLRCSSESSASSSSVGELNTRRRSPHASNISSCWLCGNHTIHDHNSGWRVTTMSLTSPGLWYTASEHNTERIKACSSSGSSPMKLKPGLGTKAQHLADTADLALLQNEVAQRPTGDRFQFLADRNFGPL